MRVATDARPEAVEPEPVLAAVAASAAQGSAAAMEWALIAERLATECGSGLLGVIERWTDTAKLALDDLEVLERLDELRDGVDAVGFFLGCLGAARGCDVLHERRERALVTRVLLALGEPLLVLRGVTLVIEGELPELRASAANWKPAVLLALAAWRVRGSGRVCCRAVTSDAGVAIRFDGGVAWDIDLTVQLPGVELLSDGLLFREAVLRSGRVS